MTIDKDMLYMEARLNFDKGEYDKAEGLLLELLKLNPNYADVYNKLGFIYHQKNEFEKAAWFFEKALQLNPGYTEASLNLSVTYNELGRFEDANKIFSNAARFAHPAPSSIDPYIQGKLANEHALLGDQYYDLGLFDEAINEYKKALKLRPNFVDIVTKAGVALREKGLFDEAIRVFMRAKEINSRYIPALIHLGITYYMKGFIDLAVEEWEGAIRIDPKNKDAQAYMNLAKKEII
ncbi:MAG: tetratricopeptide repeat protein [Nitrospirae bacterium]|nr:tetratricopeptide repeat protein [Nitrospirota bacterium]